MEQTSKNIAHKIGCKPRTSDVAFDDFISFENLNLKPNVLTGLREAGFEKPSPIQVKAIPYGLCKLDLVIQAKAGTGKTCVFTTVVLENLITENNNLQALILAPTREIATQICDVVMMIGKYIPALKCHSFIGGLPVDEDKKKLKNCHIAVATPGRMKQLMEKKVVDFEHVRFFILDEADRLLDSSFQDVIIWIYKNLPTNKQMMALSATYPESLANYVTKFMESAYIVRLDSEDPVLKGVMQYYKIISNASNRSEIFASKSDELLKVLNTVDYSQCLVFTNFQNTPESIANALKEEGFSVGFIHGDMSQVDRNSVISRLKHSEIRILVTTDLISRGIDAENVNLVINFDVPGEHQSYLHRIGRGGRFGAYSAAITLLIEAEVIDLARIERQCNSKIACLPDPLPENITERDVYANAEIPSIFDLMFKRINTVSVNKRQPESAVEPESQNESNEACLEDATSVEERLQPSDPQDVDFVNFVKLLNAGGSTYHAGDTNMSELFHDYDSLVGFENGDDREFVLNALKRIPDNHPEPVMIKVSKKPFSSLPSGGFLKKLVRQYRSDINDNVFDKLCALLPENKARLVKVFQPNAGFCNGTHDVEINNVSTNGTNYGVVNEIIPRQQPLQQQQQQGGRIKYSRDAIMYIKETMPDKYQDISHLECDLEVLSEVKKGAVSRPIFGKTERKVQPNRNIPFKNDKEFIKNKTFQLKYSDFEKLNEQKLLPANVSELANVLENVESVVPDVCEKVEIISCHSQEPASVISQDSEVDFIDAIKEEPTIINEALSASFQSLILSQVNEEQFTEEVLTDQQKENSQVDEPTDEFEKIEDVIVSGLDTPQEDISSLNLSRSQTTLNGDTKMSDLAETSGICLSDSLSSPIDRYLNDVCERYLTLSESKIRNIDEEACSVVSSASSIAIPVRDKSYKDLSSHSSKASSRGNHHHRELETGFSTGSKRDVSKVSKDSHESSKKRHAGTKSKNDHMEDLHIDQGQHHQYNQSLNEDLQNFILKSERMTMMARAHTDYVSHMIQFNRRRHL